MYSKKKLPSITDLFESQLVPIFRERHKERKELD